MTSAKSNLFLRPIPGLLPGVVLFVGYLLLVRVGLSCQMSGSLVSPFWPASGFALGFLVRFGLRPWPGLAFAALLMNLYSTQSVIALPITFGNLAQALLGAYVLRKYLGLERGIVELRSAGAFLFIACIATPLVSASIGVASLAAVGKLGSAGAFVELLTWFVGDSVSHLLVTPLFFPSQRERRPWRDPHTLVELLLGFVLLLLAALFGSGWLRIDPITSYPLGVLCFPPLLALTMRFGPTVGGVGLLIIAWTFATALSDGRGLFLPKDLYAGLAYYDLTLAALGITALLFGAAGTERGRMLAELRERDAQQRAYITASPDLFFVMDRSGRFIYFHSHNTDQLYLPPEEFLGRTISEVMPDSVSKPVMRAIEAACRTGKRQRAEYELADTAQLRQFEAYIAPEQTDRIIAIVRETTARLQSEAELQKLKLVARHTTNAVILTDADRKMVWVNEGFTRVTGYSAEEAIGQFPGQLLQGTDTDPQAIRYLADHLNKGWPCSVDILNYSKLGKPYWIEINITPVRDGRGKLIHFLGIQQDITGRKIAELALRNSEERFRRLAETTGDIFWFFKLQPPRYEYFSPSIEAVSGYPAEVFYRDPDAWQNLIHPEDRSRMIESYERWLASKETGYNNEYRIIRADGSIRWLHDTGVRICNDRGHTVGISAIARDTTDRKLTEITLRNAEEINRKLLESVPAGIVLLDPQYRIVQANAYALEFFDLTLEQVDFRPAIAQLIGEDGIEVPAELSPVARCAAEMLVQPPMTVGKHLHNGLLHWGILSVVPILDAEIGLKGIVLTVLDITLRKHMEEQYRQSQKMEAVGRLAGGVAHDFNNLLTVINGLTAALMGDTDPGSAEHESLAQIASAGERAANLTRQLLMFGRKQLVQVSSVQVNEVVRGFEKILRRLVGDRVKLEISLEESLCDIRADVSQIEQILLNLTVTARDAMPNGGHLSITTQTVRLNGPLPGVAAAIRPGLFCRLEFRDTGCGIPPEVLPHIFEPFFTTKDHTLGTGLGLATVYGVVKQSEGYITVSSVEGHGTTFQIYLPAMVLQTPVPPPVGPRTPLPIGTETILVAEDDPAIRRLTVQALRASGYEVWEAADGAEAMERYHREGRPIHVLVTDAIMPNIGGRELADRLTALQPGLSVLFVSGFTDDEVLREGIRRDRVRFLQKPFRPAQLAARVRELVEESTGLAIS